ncbi:signal peptide protein [Caballeronia catudaia]|uniref:Signal peptide protein n=1 Tax=Caballeronia catudaia TaxID=1777136 RepID=A0A158AKJ3_9BURK|nr:hypothetical protein [Caballeronia catudaia]SAK58225.1 signal peptide protein [Caballeronia catudaia]
MKVKFALGIVAGIVILQSGCTTQSQSLPMPAEAQNQNKDGVALYFSDQPHAKVKTLIESKEVRVRVGRDPNSKEPMCNVALGKALQDLRGYARTKNANAVVNVTTRFQGKEISSSTEFKCGSSVTGATLAVRGDVVQLATE